MKQNVWILCLCVNLLYTHQLVAQNSASDALDAGIQDRIYSAFIDAFSNQSTTQLKQLQSTINDSKSEQFKNYWLPYLKYYESIYYLKTGDKKNAKKVIEEGIKILENVKKKDSESYALLAHLMSFSIQFENLMSTIKKANVVKECAEKSIKLDPNNPRAWYVLGCNDYYKPKEYGGKKKCEEYFLKAIRKKEPINKDSSNPSWGISDAYSLLVGYYMEVEKVELAKQYLKQGLELYPDDYMLNQYQTTLK